MERKAIGDRVEFTFTDTNETVKGKVTSENEAGFWMRTDDGRDVFVFYHDGFPGSGTGGH